jgi:hypothetical protein
MYRKIRSAISAGVIVIISILLAAPQPTLADRSKTIYRLPEYAGHIHLKAKYVFNENGVVEYDFLETQGSIYLTYNSSSKSAWIFFYPWTIQEADIEEGSWGATTFAVATSKSPFSTSFSDTPSETYFIIPFSIRGVTVNSQSCWETSPGPCGDGSWKNSEEHIIYGHAAILTTIKLTVLVNSGGSLSGSCYLPGWDKNPYHSTTYSEDCMWTSHQIVAKDSKPEWMRKK